MTERVKIATETIAKASKGRELSEDNFFFVLIKDEKISFSKELDSIDDADECILYIPSYWDNTVKDKYGPGDVTFRNPIHVIRYIDSEGNIKDYYSKYNFGIFNQSRWIDNNILSLSYYGDTPVYNLIEIEASENGFRRIWDCYQTAKKCLQAQGKDFENTKSELENKINSLSSDYDKFKQRYEKLVSSINGLVALSETEN